MRYRSPADPDMLGTLIPTHLTARVAQERSGIARGQYSEKGLNARPGGEPIQLLSVDLSDLTHRNMQLFRKPLHRSELGIDRPGSWRGQLWFRAHELRGTLPPTEAQTLPEIDLMEPA
jgi:hypothetical protein